MDNFMKTQKLITLGLTFAITIQLSACVMEENLKTLGTAVGAVAGSRITNNPYLQAAATGIGAMIGAELGRRLGKYLDEQDQQKLQQQLNTQVENPKPQVSVACTGETGNYRSVSIQQARSMDCGDNNKVILSTSATSNLGGEQCKTLKTEVMNDQGTLETINMKSCKDSNGAWHEKAA